MKQPGRIALAAVNIAEAHVGVLEVGGNNRGPEVEAFLAAAQLPPGQPWCAAFVRYSLERAAEEAGAPLPRGFPDSGWCPAFEAWGKREGLWIPAVRNVAAEARRGDLALFYFPAKGRVAHIGFVTGAADQHLLTCEGNTGPDAPTGGVTREGDGVYRKRRSWLTLGALGGLVRLPF